MKAFKTVDRRLDEMQVLPAPTLINTFKCKFRICSTGLPSRVYAYAAGDGDGADKGESAKPAQNDFQARLAMFKKKETGPSGRGA